MFEHVNANGQYNTLHSTRHFGPMVFHLVYHKKCDDLMFHYISRERRLEDAASVVRVYGLAHPDSAVAGKLDLPALDLIRHYIDNDSLKSARLNAALEATLEAMEREKEALEGSKKAQGVTEDEK